MNVTENPNLKFFLDKKVEDLIVPENYHIEDGAKERHRLYSLLLMAITKYYWNTYKNGKDGKYPLNPTNYGKFEKNDYYGHNIASIAVDAYGEVIDFEFNHNNTFSSTTEHAEARMVKRVFSLTQINDSWKVSLEKKENENEKKKHTFEDVVLYTTLESCSQCAGIMALARVKEIVYLQTDPGMYLIGNILRNLTRKIENVQNSGGLTSPMPISGADINFQYYERLNSEYKIFQEKVKTTPFFEPDNPTSQNKIDFSPSITSFLCTDTAFQLYKNATIEFESLSEDSLQFANYKPKDKAGIEIQNARTNKNVLAEIKDFYLYATKSGKRGTPHK